MRDECWMVWFRSGLEPDGRWYAWEFTASMLRADAIAEVTSLYGRGEAWWRSHRRRGLVKCVRTELRGPTDEA